MHGRGPREMHAGMRDRRIEVVEDVVLVCEPIERPDHAQHAQVLRSSGP